MEAGGIVVCDILASSSVVQPVLVGESLDLTSLDLISLAITYLTAIRLFSALGLCYSEAARC